MQNHFNVTSIIGDFSRKTITIETTFAVDKASATKKNVTIANGSTGTQSIYSLDVDENKIIATFKDWPDITSEYQVNITYIKDMLGRDLTHPVTKIIAFKSEVKETVAVISPLHSEIVFQQNELIYIGLKVINEEGKEYINKNPDLEGLFGESDDIEPKGASYAYNYNIEVATDIAFFNIVKELTLENYTDGVVQLENAQYYMRARIDDGLKIGDWSDTVSFSVMPLPCEGDADVSEAEKEYLKDVLAPVEFFLEDEKFEILSMSKNGELIKEFYIEFSKDIDIQNVPLIISAFRRDI